MKKVLLKPVAIILALFCLICDFSLSTSNNTSNILINADAAGYNSSAAIAYAKKYWKNYNPAYPNCNPIGGDCANFVSQCLYAGGLEQNGTWKVGSAAWQACPSMYEYFKNNGYQIIIDPSDDEVIEGNPVLYYSASKGRWSHAAICIGHNASGGARIAAHNNDHYDVDWKLGSDWLRRCTILINKSSKSYNPEGYIDTAEGGAGTVTVTGWAVDRDSINESIDVHIYTDGPSGQGGTYIGAVKADQPSPDVASVMGYSGNHRFTATFNIDAVGNHTFYAHGINIGGGDTNSLLNNSCETYILEKTNSVISNVYISQVTPSGYTVNIAVSDESKVGRIAVPVWTSHKAAEHGNYEAGQDDLLSGWESLSIAKKIGTNTYVFDVNIEDHNSESGEYCNDVYVYGHDGSQLDRWCKETGHRTYANVPSEKVITNVSPYSVTHSGYMLNIKVADDSKIGKIAVPVWTSYYQKENNYYEMGQDDLLSGWQDISVAKKIASNEYVFPVSTFDHNNESGEYNNDVYVYDRDGNMIDRWCLETKHRTYVNVPSEEIINNVSINNVTPYGYDISVTVADESKIGRIVVPVWTSYYPSENNHYEQGQDDLNSSWQTKCIAKKTGENIYVYHVNIADHNNESGEYNNDIYVYDNEGNMLDRWCIETSHRVYAYVPDKTNGDANADGAVSVADLVMLQRWLLTESNELTCWQNVDLCEDGVIDTFDMVMLRRLLIEKGITK